MKTMFTRTFAYLLILFGLNYTQLAWTANDLNCNQQLRQNSAHSATFVIDNNQYNNQNKSLAFQSLFNEIEEIIKFQPNQLSQWVTKPIAGQISEFNQIEFIAESKESPFPLKMSINGKVKFTFIKLIGEGKRGRVYLTDDGLAVKVLKQLDSPRELVLQFWSSQLWKNEGISVPKIYEIDDKANYLVQEYITGDTIFDIYNEDSSNLTSGLSLKFKNSEELLHKILKVKTSAEKIFKSKGLYFDLKAANFIVNDRNQLFFVDNGPRLDKNKTKYYLGPDNKKLSSSLFLDYFLFRQFRDENLRPHFEAEELILPKGNDALTRYRAIIERSEVVDDSSAHLSEAFQWEIKKDRAYDFFQLARELWQEQEAITIRELLETVNKSQQPLPEVSLKLKSFRAILKRIRSASIAFSVNHSPPERFARLVVNIGKLRDSWKRNDLTEANKLANDIIEQLNKKNLKKLQHELDSFEADSKNGFSEWLLETKKELSNSLKSGQMTAEQFHNHRKIVSTLLAIAEIRYSFKPNLRTFNQVTFLRRLNVKTGLWHDVFVMNGFQETDDYKNEKLVIPNDLIESLTELRDKLLIK